MLEPSRDPTGTCMKVTRNGQSIPGHWLLSVLSIVLGLKKGQALAIAQQLPHHNVAVL